MKIESKIKRDGGTHVLLGTTNYHFAPLADGAHVAAVTIEAHQDRFLSITEGFGLYRGNLDASTAKLIAEIIAAPAPVAPVEQAAPIAEVVDVLVDVNHVETLYGSSSHPSRFDINGASYALGDVVDKAHAASGLDVKEWNELDEDTRADLIDEELDKLNATAGAATADATDAAITDKPDERAAFVDQYKARFGVKPHHKWTIAKIVEALAAT